MGDNTIRVNPSVPSVMSRPELPRTEDAARPALLITVNAVNLTGVIVAVTGELDFAVTRALTTVLDAQLDAGRRDVLIDVSNLAFCSCAGLGAILASRHRLAAVGGTLTLTGLEGYLERLLRLTELDQVFLTA